MKEKIRADKVLFIKLGQKGGFETDCIENSNTLRLDYREVDHALGSSGKWDLVHSFFMTEEKAEPAVATSHTNQVKQFYEEDGKTHWVTFYKNKLW